MLFKACHVGWVNKSGVAREGCKSLGYCCFQITNWGKSLGFFQVCVYSQKQLCKDDCPPPALVASRWRSKASPRGRLPLVLSWADPGTVPSLTHPVLVGKTSAPRVCNPWQQRSVNGGRYLPLTNPSSERGAWRGGSAPGWVASLAFGESLFLYASRSGAGGAKLGEKKLLLLRAVLPGRL